MEQKILLEKNRSKYSVNTDSYIGFDLSGKSKLLPFDAVNDTLNLNQLYMDERDSSEKFRMIFTVNPICSNVLFNMKTEVMKKEGSDDCIVLIGETAGDREYAVNTKPLNLRQAIKDTEYSHPELFGDEVPYVYHCGTDIFNNHMLRNDDFVYVNKVNDKDKDVFNTIEDIVRSISGDTIKNVQEDVTPGFTGQTKKDIHVYQYDTILSMYNAFINRLKEKDGWYGFNNSTNIAIPNVIIEKNNDTKEISINKVMNNNKACEFIDMYPDRSLYSFIPKVNKYKRRIEKNWDYCITYPYEKDIDKLQEMCGIESIEMNAGGDSIRIVQTLRTYSASGNNVIRMKPLFRHNLEIGDYIKLYYKDGDDLKTINKRIRIVNVGDYDGSETNRYFSIDFNDISSRFNVVEEGDNKDMVVDSNNEPVQFFYKKDVYGIECQYYFRKFKAITKEGDEWLDSEVNKLAYGENIYGDRIAQVVFTDDIDVEGLVDHRGRPLTEVYFTVVKRNAGHDKWYEENKFTETPEERESGITVEFSHCFGKVTTGIDLPMEETKFNVRKIHNVNVSAIENNTLIFNPNLKDGYDAFIEDDITIDSYKDGVIADIVEYNPYYDREIVLDVVQHRFNTAQRETTNPLYADIWYDDLVSDDYDFKYKGLDSDKKGDGTLNGFSVSSYTLNKSVKIDDNDNIIEKKNPGNINPEGYFYNPYTKVMIRELYSETEKVIGKVISFDYNNVSKEVDNNENNIIIFNTVIPSKLIKNDTLALYNNVTKELSWGVIIGVSGNTIAMIVNDDMEIDDTYTLISTTEGVPAYATYLPTSHSFVWRPIVKMSELENDSELLNMPFSNGRHYIEKNTMIYLKRQDPNAEFGLFAFDKNAEYKSRLSSYRIKGWEPIDLSIDRYNNFNLGGVCY